VGERIAVGGGGRDLHSDVCEIMARGKHAVVEFAVADLFVHALGSSYMIGAKMTGDPSSQQNSHGANARPRRSCVLPLVRVLLALKGHARCQVAGLAERGAWATTRWDMLGQRYGRHGQLACAARLASSRLSTRAWAGGPGRLHEWGEEKKKFVFFF
jgi:hypothetical protein